jgi:hypothetical protein
MYKSVGANTKCDVCEIYNEGVISGLQQPQQKISTSDLNININTITQTKIKTNTDPKNPSNPQTPCLSASGPSVSPPKSHA